MSKEYPRVHFTRVSSNQKTGPIPTTVTERSTCPDTCSFKSNGCYAETANVNFHWKAVSEGKRGGTWNEMCKEVSKLPRGQLWRHNVAGDLPTTKAGNLSLSHIERLVQANRGRRGFTYTHHRPSNKFNRLAVQLANRGDFTVNLSAESLDEADDYADLGIAPVVVALPADVQGTLTTPKGRTVALCPATQGNIDCLNCGICQKADRKAIIGFPAHGTGAKKVSEVFWAKQRAVA